MSPIGEWEAWDTWIKEQRLQQQNEIAEEMVKNEPNIWWDRESQSFVSLGGYYVA